MGRSWTDNQRAQALVTGSPRVLSEALAPRADTGALKPEQRHAGRLSHQREKCNLKGNKWQERGEGRGQRSEVAGRN